MKALDRPNFKLTDDIEDPIGIDYTYLHAKRIRQGGDITSIEYYNVYDGITFSDLVVTELFTYSRTDGVVTLRDETILYYLSDESIGYTSSLSEYYTSESNNIDREYNIISVSKTPNESEFSSIKTAVDSITMSSTGNPYVVKVGPGIYFEDTIVMKAGISVSAETLGSVLIIPNTNTSTIFRGYDGSSIINLVMNGANGSGGKAVYHEGSGGTGFLIKDCNFDNNDTQVHCYGTGSSTAIVYVDRCSTTGNITNGFVVGNTSSTPSQVVLTNCTYKDLSYPVVTTFASVSGINSLLTITNTTISISASASTTGISVSDGGEARILSSSIRGFGTSIHVPNTGTQSNLILESVSITDSVNYDLLIEQPFTTGHFSGVIDYEKTSLVNNVPFFILNKDPYTIKVALKGGDFTSISTAVNSITDASDTKRYLVLVGAGTFIEPLIDLSSKPYISVAGLTIQSTVVIPDGNHHVFSMGSFNEVSFLTISDVPLGYAGIAALDSGDFSQAHKVSFQNADIGILVTSITQNTLFYGEYIDMNGIYSYGIKSIASNGFEAFCNLENYYNIPATSSVVGSYLSGLGSSMVILGSGHTSDGTGKAFYLEDGANIEITSTDIDNWDIAVDVANIGLPSSFKITGTIIEESTTWDISNTHISSFGLLSGVSSHTKINNLSPNVSWSFLDIIDGEFEVTNQLSMTFLDGTHTDISTAIIKSSTMGLNSGGGISQISSFTVSIGSGYGYLEKTGTDILVKHIWATQSIGLSASTNNYLFINEGGSLTKGTNPTSENNIILGRVVTDGLGISFIDESPINASHTSNKFGRLLREGIGVVYSSGSIVTENATQSHHIDISNGNYFYSSNQYQPTGGNNITFDAYYQGTSSNWIITSTNSVSNSHYDGGTGSLISLSTSYYAKHSIYIVGEGIHEKYFMVYAQAQYLTQLEAEQALPPNPPNYFNDGVTTIAGIIVQQGTSSIIEVRDQRSTVAFKSEGTSAGSSHGNLLGLGNDDHTQYLRTDGDRTMTGNLNLGNNLITNSGTINGVSITSHQSRHLPNGSDPLDHGTPSSIGTVNQEGIINAFARQDHIHALGTNIVADTNILSHTSSKITIVSKSLLNTSIAYVDQANTFGTFSQVFKSSNLLLTNPGNTFNYTFVGSSITANRNTTIPLLTSDDTFAFQAFSQSLTNKTLLSSDNNVIDATRLYGFTVSNTTPTTGHVLGWNGTSWISTASSGGGSSRTTATVSTTNATPTVVGSISTLVDNATNIVEVYVKAYQSSATQWGIWKRTLSVTKVSGTVTIREVNSDVDKQSTGLRATSVTFVVNSGNIDITVTGIAATTINWKSAHEIIL